MSECPIKRLLLFASHIGVEKSRGADLPSGETRRRLCALLAAARGTASPTYPAPYLFPKLDALTAAAERLLCVQPDRGPDLWHAMDGLDRAMAALWPLAAVPDQGGDERQDRGGDQGDGSDHLGPQPGSVDETDLQILSLLKQAAPKRLHLSDLAAAHVCSSKTAGQRIARLIGLGYAARPNGIKGGISITHKGEKLLS